MQSLEGPHALVHKINMVFRKVKDVAVSQNSHCLVLIPRFLVTGQDKSCLTLTHLDVLLIRFAVY